MSLDLIIYFVILLVILLLIFYLNSNITFEEPLTEQNRTQTENMNTPPIVPTARPTLDRLVAFVNTSTIDLVDFTHTVLDPTKTGIRVTGQVTKNSSTTFSTTPATVTVMHIKTGLVPNMLSLQNVVFTATNDPNVFTFTATAVYDWKPVF